MPDTLKRNGFTVTVEGTWYEVSNGTEVVEYGNVKEGTTPKQVYERLQSEGLIKVDSQDTLSEMPQSAKELKQQIEQSMSEFKAQQRDYYAKWEEWRGAKEEWIDCALEEDNLSQRAEWSVEACRKQVCTSAQNAINVGIEKAAISYSAKDIYAALQPHLDPSGHYLLQAAEKLTNFNVVKEYPVDDSMYHFVTMDGFGQMRYLEAAKFGEREYRKQFLDSNCLDKYIIHSDTPQFKAYQNNIFDSAVNYMKKLGTFTSDMEEYFSSNMKDILSAVSAFKNIGEAELTPKALPQEGWIGKGEHRIAYTIASLYESDMDERYERRYEEVTGADYRLYETFHQPDDKVPDAPQLESPVAGASSNKLLNLLMPERETPRLQSELKLLINNTSVMRDYVGSLDKSILEMKGEISQMREHNAQAGREIAGGKPFNNWMRLNLSAEIKNLGLDPEKVNFQDLMKTLSQNAPEPQRAQEIAMEME